MSNNGDPAFNGITPSFYEAPFAPKPDLPFGSQFGSQFGSPWGVQGAQAELSYNNSSFGGVVESIKPPTDRDLKSVAHEKHEHDDEEEEGAHDTSLSCDCYSMVILSATGYGYFSTHFAVCVLLCFFCISVQVVSLAFAVLELADAWLPSSGSQCCSRILDHPVNVETLVRVGQWFALVFAVASLENILCIDTLAWVNIFMPGSSKRMYEKEEEGCDILDHKGGNLFAFASKKCPILWFSMVTCRLGVGLLSFWTSIVIVVQAETNIDLFKDFAALQVIASLDNLLFCAASARFFGTRLRDMAKKVENTPFHCEDIFLPTSILKCLGLCIFGWGAAILAVVMNAQIEGAFCKELIVNTGSDNMIFLSGYYKFKGDYLADRPMYVLMHPSGEIYSQCLDGSKTCKPEDRIPRFKLLYCELSGTWTIMQLKAGQDKNQELAATCDTQWLVASADDYGFDVLSPESWVEFNRETGVNKIDMIIKCNACEVASEDIHCNRGGSCVVEDGEKIGRCECREGGFGPMCEFQAPCLTVEPSFLPGKSNFAFRGQYKILKEDPSELATLNEDATQFFKREKITMSASMRPVYVRPAGTGNANISNGEIDDTTAVLFHDGARWNMLQIVDVDPSLGKAPTESQIRKAFRSFNTADINWYCGGSYCGVYSSMTQAVSPEHYTASPYTIQTTTAIKGKKYIEKGSFDGFECKAVDLDAQGFLDGDQKLDRRRAMIGPKDV